MRWPAWVRSLFGAAGPQTPAEFRRVAARAKERSELFQQRADYWYRIQTECDDRACQIEDEARDVA